MKSNADTPDETPQLAALVDEIAARRRQIAALQADEIALMARALDYALERMDEPRLDAERPRDIPLRSVAAEIGAATRTSDRGVQARLNDAHELVTRFPQTFSALADGRIDRAHASVVADAGANIRDDDARARYEAAILPVAERETPGRLRPIARTLAQRLHPVPLDERHREARRSRRVWVRDGDDGMAELGLIGPALLIHGIHDRVTQLATLIVDARGATKDADELAGLEAPSSPDDRRLDEVRADVMCDLLLAGAPAICPAGLTESDLASVHARVQVTIPVLTLLGRSDEPAELEGYGPLDLDTARELAAGAPGWDRILTHPITGAVLAVDRYRPSAEQKRLLHTRDEHCRFPGCRQPARRCDLDHTVARAHDGPTRLDNLACLCRRHHTLKHHSAWRVRQLPGGVLEWTSPSGTVYADLPARTLAFVADDTAPF